MLSAWLELVVSHELARLVSDEISGFVASNNPPRLQTDNDATTRHEPQTIEQRNYY